MTPKNLDLFSATWPPKHPEWNPNLTKVSHGPPGYPRGAKMSSKVVPEVLEMSARMPKWRHGAPEMVIRGAKHDGGRGRSP